MNLERILDHACAAFEEPFGRVHGNGFVQLETPRGRIHIWHPSIPSQATPTPIHSHRFSFLSTALVGRLVNVRYSLAWGQSHEVCHVVRDGEDTILAPTGRTFRPAVTDVDECFAGESYAMPHGEFHETFATGLTVTVMEKTFENGDDPEVLCRRGQVPDNQFYRNAAENRKASQQAIADAWEAVKEEWCL